MTEIRIPEISCPICGKIFSAKPGKPRTRRQWRAAVIIHLAALLRPGHHLQPNEAISVTDAYVDSL